ncbi:MAG: hypothetical protein WC943_01865, partial [Elusimicrobiota bacterium]
MKNSLAGRLGLLCGALLAGFVAFEVGARLLLEPSDLCWGVLLGRALPPFSIPVSPSPAPAASP